MVCLTKKDGGSKSGWSTARHTTRAGGGEEEMVIMFMMCGEYKINPDGAT